MNRYQALAVGTRVRRLPEMARQAVVYPKAVNFIGADGLVLSLVAGTSAMSAHSVLVPQMFTRRRDELRGATVRRDGERLFVGGTLTIELDQGSAWSGFLPEQAGREITRDRLDLFRQALLRRGRPGGFLGLLAPAADRSLENPFSARAAAVLAESPAGRPLRGLGRLVGLGPGLTPAGDDFLTGVLLGEQIGRRQPSGRPETGGYPEIDRQEIEAALGKTSPPGKNLLWLALRGHFPAYLLELVAGIERSPSPRQMEEAVLATIIHGETSGTDASVGLVWYLERGS